MKNLLIVFCVLLIGCADENINKVNKLIGSQYSVKEITITKNYLIDTQKGRVNTIKIEAEMQTTTNEVLNRFYKNRINLASSFAKILVDNAEPGYFENVEKIVSVIKDDTSSFEATYSVEELRQIDAQINFANQYLSQLKKHNYDTLINYVNTELIPPDKLETVIELYKEAETNNGQIEKITLIGFDFYDKGYLGNTVKVSIATITVKEVASIHSFLLPKEGKLEMYGVWIGKD